MSVSSLLRARHYIFQNWLRFSEFVRHPSVILLGVLLLCASNLFRFVVRLLGSSGGQPTMMSDRRMPFDSAFVLEVYLIRRRLQVNLFCRHNVLADFTNRCCGLRGCSKDGVRYLLLWFWKVWSFRFRYGHRPCCMSSITDVILFVCFCFWDVNTERRLKVWAKAWKSRNIQRNWFHQLGLFRWME